MGKLIIFSAPSGSGKSTIINYLLTQNLNLAFSISATSRPPRGTEQNGVEYFFLTPDEFRSRIANDEFLEYEEVYQDRFYGTLKAQVEKQLAARLIPLGMPNTRFRVDILPRKEPESDGMDDIRFMFSANKSAELQPVAQTASGGEISRLMLCIKAMIAGFTALPTIIFDEVDTGVSGDIADKMGDIMQELGTKMQVFAITHLPQIAAKGQAHYFVYKKDTKDRTLTRIKQLEGEERVNEVARMLIGASLTEASLANAKDLLGIKD